MCTNSEPTIPSSFATSPFSIRSSKKARSCCLSFSSAAKVYFNSASANAALSERSADAISGSIIQNSARWRLVRVLRAEGRPEWAVWPSQICASLGSGSTGAVQYDACINSSILGEAMERRIDAHIARTQFGQIMDLAVKNNERFIVDRRGEPAVVIMSIQDFIRTAAPPPDWLQKAWSGAKRRGLGALTPSDVDTEIAAYRREKEATNGNGHR